MIKSPQYWAGKLLGFYEAGDNVLAWMNSFDSSEMTVKEFRKQLNMHIMTMRLKVPNGRRTATQSKEDCLRS